MAISKCTERSRRMLTSSSRLRQAYVTNFGEEVVRAQSLFPLSILVQKLEPMLREAAGLGSWQVRCHGQSARIFGVLSLIRPGRNSRIHSADCDRVC